MKALRLLALLAVAAPLVRANPTLVHLYNFANGSLNDSIGNTALQNNYGGTVGNGYFSFGANQGPTLAVDSSLATDYTIGLQFQLSLNPNGTDIDGNPWQAIVNLSDLASDGNNQYLYLGYPQFYPGSNGPDQVTNQVTVDMVLTWNGTDYAAYLNGNLEDSFSTFGRADAVVPTAADARAVAQGNVGKAVFQLFQDDNHSGEATPGTVYQIRVWNGALTQGQVGNAFAPVQINQAPDAGSLLPVWTAVLAGFGWAGRRNRRKA